MMGPGFVCCNRHTGYMNAQSFRTIYSILGHGKGSLVHLIDPTQALKPGGE